MNVFLCYAQEDLSAAIKLYDVLTHIGINVWFDQQSLRPGENWKAAITKAIRNSRYFLSLLSNNVESKKGYVQKEIKEALDILDLFPDNEIYFVPIRLEKCEPPIERLRNLQWVDFFPDWDIGLRKLFILFGISEQLVQSFMSTPIFVSRKLRTGGTYVTDQIGENYSSFPNKRYDRMYLRFHTDGKVVLTSSFDDPAIYIKALINNSVELQPWQTMKYSIEPECIEFKYATGYKTSLWQVQPRGNELVAKRTSADGFRSIHYFQFIEDSFFL